MRKRSNKLQITNILATSLKVLIVSITFNIAPGIIILSLTGEFSHHTTIDQMSQATQAYGLFSFTIRFIGFITSSIIGGRNIKTKPLTSAIYISIILMIITLITSTFDHFFSMYKIANSPNIPEELAQSALNAPFLSQIKAILLPGIIKVPVDVAAILIMVRTYSITNNDKE